MGDGLESAPGKLPGSATAAPQQNPVFRKWTVPPPVCHTGTCVDFLKTICAWRDDAQRTGNIFCVTGPPGSGKSAIARTFAENCARIGRLGAALFFSHIHHGDGFSQVILTLACQLATHSPSYERLLIALLENDGSTAESSLSAQFRKLIEEPIQVLQTQGLFDPQFSRARLIVVLDGLNDYRDRDAQIELTGLIVDHIRSHRHNSPFLWVICSRSESYLQQSLDDLENAGVPYCTHIELPVNDTCGIPPDFPQVYPPSQSPESSAGFFSWLSHLFEFPQPRAAPRNSGGAQAHLGNATLLTSDSLFSRYPQLHPLGRNSKASTRLLSRLSDILRTPGLRKALYNLKSDKAQLMVDYLHSVLIDPSSPMSWIQKYSLIALYKLSKASLVYPHCYILREITFGSHESGGAFSDVHKGQHGDRDLCLKVIRIHQKSDTDAMLKIYAKEAILWGQLCHPNIVPFYGIYYLNEARRQVCLVSPWMRNGSLVDYLKNNPDAHRKPFIYDIIDGLEYLHSQHLIHGDIKGMNILVNDSKRACITDFGLSFIRTDQTVANSATPGTSYGCSYRWAAPELLEEGTRATLASDVWAFGCVCYEIITGLVPFHGLSDPQVFRKLMNGELPSAGNRAFHPNESGDTIWDLISRCWRIRPVDRPTCQEISQELKRKGLAREQEGGIEDMNQARQHFLEAMRKNEEVSINLDQVEQILNEISEI